MSLASRCALLALFFAAACSSPAEPTTAPSRTTSPIAAPPIAAPPIAAPPIAAPPVVASPSLGPLMPLGSGSGLRGDAPVHGPSSRIPIVHVTEPTVGPSASLSMEILRRVVRRHVNEIRSCYERSLATAPDLSGRVSTRWTIEPTGSVEGAALVSSTLTSAAAPDGGPPARALEACVLAAIPRWTFPAPMGGGVVNVTYPFDFHMEVRVPTPSTPPQHGREGTIGLEQQGVISS